jgi:uncharacterized short protein YbdD (DUF466 family)
VSLSAELRKGAAGVAWFVKGVLGEDAYDKYRAHYAAAHGESDGSSPGMMTEREFWKDRMDRQDANPQGRCC